MNGLQLSGRDYGTLIKVFSNAPRNDDPWGQILIAGLAAAARRLIELNIGLALRRRCKHVAFSNRTEAAFI